MSEAACQRSVSQSEMEGERTEEGGDRLPMAEEVTFMEGKSVIVWMERGGRTTGATTGATTGVTTEGLFINMLE